MNARRLKMIGLVTGVLCLLPPDSFATELDGPGPVEVDAAAIVQQIMDDWRSPENRGAQKIEWRINSHAKNETFGANVTKGSATVVVLYDDSHVHLETDCFPPDEVFQLSPFRPAGRRMAADVKLEEFKTALYSRFRKRLKPKVVQPYLMVRDSDRELHLWSQVGESGQFAAICKPGEGPRCFQEPIVFWLVDGLTLCQCIPPTEEPAESAVWRVLPEQVSMQERHCAVLELRRGDNETGDLLHAWVDLADGSRVRRCLVRSFDGSLRRQYDFQYAATVTGRVPAAVNIILFATTGAVHDSLSLSLIAHEPVHDLDLARQQSIPPATLVTDCLARRRFFVENDGSVREVTDPDLLAWSSFERIQLGDQNPVLESDEMVPALDGSGVLPTGKIEWPHLLNILLIGLGVITLFGVGWIVLHYRWSRRTMKFAVLGMLPVVVATMIVHRIDLDDSANRSAYEILMHLVARIESIRSSPATPSDWREFQIDALADLNPLIESLSIRSSRFPVQQHKWFSLEVVNAKSRQELLQAANGLKSEVEGGLQRGNSSYLQHVSRAGEILQGGSLAGIQTPSAVVVNQLTIGLIGINVLLFTAGAVYWQRRQRMMLRTGAARTE